MPKIPKYYHFVFGLKKQTTPFHLMHFLCLKSCLEVNRPEKVFFYYHYEPFGDYWDLIKPQLQLEKVRIKSIASQLRYKNKRVRQYKYAHLADFIRLEKLIARGGIYADMDTLFIRPLPDIYFEKDFILGQEPDIVNEMGERTSSLCNAWIASKKGAKFGRLWLAQMPAYFDGSWSNHSTVLPAKLSQQHPELIFIAPQSAFYDFIWTREGIADILENNVEVSRDVYSLHLWAHLWWDRSRRDFSNFHQGLLTYAYVDKAETTYAALAKSFLPEKPAASEIRKKSWLGLISKR